MRKIFIDGGARTGELFDIIKKDLPEYLGYEFIIYEPNPTHSNTLMEKAKENNATFINGAIWDKNGEYNFYIAIDIYGDQGSTLCKDKQRDKLDIENPILVKTYDIVDIINQFNPEDYIVLKLDIEGGEYDVIKRLIETNNLHKVNEYIIEWHDYFFEGIRLNSSSYVDEINKYSKYKTWNY